MFFEIVDDVAESGSTAERTETPETLEYEVVDDGADFCVLVDSLQTSCPASSAGPRVGASSSCGQCGVRGRGTRRCSRCRSAWYCSLDCQRAAWCAGHQEVCDGSFASSPPSTESVIGGCLEDVIAQLQLQGEEWRLPSTVEVASHQETAMVGMQRLLPVLLEAHARGAWTEHHTSGLLDREDALLPPRSPQLVQRLRDRIFYYSLGESLRRAGAAALACGAFARAALTSCGWTEAYHAWDECLEAAGQAKIARGVHELAVRRGVWRHAAQRPNDLYLRGLRAQAIWDPRTVPEASELEAAYKDILAEYRGFCTAADGGEGAWTPIADRPLLVAGDWRDVKLIENGKWHAVNCARCPRTMRVILDRCPEIASQVKGSLIFSRLAGGTVIRPHCGPTNCRLRIHLALEVPEGESSIRVGTERLKWEEGKCIVFDDSFEHEVVHPGKRPRVVLIADIWHPELTECARRRHLHGRHLRRYEGALAARAAWHSSGLGEESVAEAYEAHRIASTEVRYLEGILRRQVPELVEVATTVHVDEAGRQTLIVYVECVAGVDSANETNSVCDRCAQACAREIEPFGGLASLVLAVSALPRGQQGKVDRDRLPEPPFALLP